MHRISMTNSKWADLFASWSIMSLVLLLTALFFGCSGQSVRVFNEQGLNEQELATVTTHEEGGLFGTSMYFKSVNDNSVSGHFEKGVQDVKVTPGKHTFEVIFHDQSFSLFDSDQHLIISFSFDAIGGHKYIVNYDIDKTVTERLTFGGSHAGWIEDITTGDKLPMDSPY